MKCTKHPRYQVKRSPRVLCEGCWYLWIAKKLEPNVSRHYESLEIAMKRAEAIVTAGLCKM